MAAAASGGGGDIEELIKKLNLHRGVQGFLIVNHEGIPIRHSFAETSRSLAVQYSALFQSLAMKSKSLIQELDNSNELLSIRCRTLKHEIIIAPDSKYVVIIIQEQENNNAGGTAATNTGTAANTVNAAGSANAAAATPADGAGAVPRRSTVV